MPSRDPESARPGRPPVVAEEGRYGGVPPSGPALGELALELRQRGRQLGLAAIAIGPATPMEPVRVVLEERKAAGLSGGMQFTYRNPARSTDPARALPGAMSLVVGAWSYGREGPGRMSGETSARPQGLVARYARRRYYEQLRAALAVLAGRLHEMGWQARVLADDNALVDRAAAERAGLGWFGKNANLLVPGLGSWFVIGSVVTDAPLPFDHPVKESCGPCRRCLRSCPTGALIAPGVLDARRCLAWLVQAPGVFPWEHRVALGRRLYGCDDCQETCPVNKSAVRQIADVQTPAEPAQEPGTTGPTATTGPIGTTASTGMVGDHAGAEVDVLALLAASDEELLDRFGPWYIAQRDPRYLKRNALLILGNIGDPGAPEVIRAVKHYLDSADEMLRAHAVWAALRLGRADLIDGAPSLLEGPSPLVQAELQRRDEVPVRNG